MIVKLMYLVMVYYWEIYTLSKDNIFTNISTLNYTSELKRGYRPALPPDCPNDFEQLVHVIACGEFYPQKGQSFQQIVRYLSKLIRKENKKHRSNDFGQVQFDNYPHHESQHSGHHAVY